MHRPRRLLAATLIGAGYGGLTSALNDLSSAYGDLGGDPGSRTSSAQVSHDVVICSRTGRSRKPAELHLAGAR
jgi:hypothetical protein